MIELPYEKAYNLTTKGKDYGLTIEGYKYMNMPKFRNNKLYILVTPSSFEEGGIAFYSEDEGKTWEVS